jgi:hypothetical protein
MWFILSVAHGYEVAGVNWNDWAKELELTPAQIDEAQRLAREWGEKKYPR